MTAHLVQPCDENGVEQEWLCSTNRLVNRKGEEEEENGMMAQIRQWRKEEEGKSGVQIYQGEGKPWKKKCND